MASGAGVSNSSKSLYEILGVNKSDSITDIKKAYLKLARIHHPDRGGDPEKFKEIQHACEILTDDNKRRMYDEFGVTGDGPGGMQPGGMPGGFQFPFEVNLNDLFGGMFGSSNAGVQRGAIRKGKKPAPAVQTINATMEQFYLGNTFSISVNRNVFCKECEHTGAKSKELCKKCGGKGMLSQIVQMGPMAMHTTGPCIDCQGKGERILEQCGLCTGSGFTTEKRTLTVHLTPGTRPGETFIFPEVCSDHIAFERPGDAHIIVTEDQNDPSFKYFKRTGDKLENLETKVSLSLSESLIGCVVRIDGHPGYDDGLFVKIPAGSFKEDRYCLTGFGMPVMGDIGRYGDLFIVIDVSITLNERKLFTTKGHELLAPLFEDKIRVCEAPDGAVQDGVFLTKLG